MTHLLLLSEADVQQLLEPASLLDALAGGFAALSSGHISAPNRLELTVSATEFLLAMPAYQQPNQSAPPNQSADVSPSPAAQPFAVKLVTVFPGNEHAQFPSHQALICLFDATTGTPLALLGGAALTALRTAGATALSTRLLARAESRVLAIIGAGAQGKAHLRLLPQVLPFTEIRIASRQFAHAQQLAALDQRAHPVASIEEALRDADVVCLCTSAAAPVIQRAWLAPGTHITSVGYHPPDGELPRDVVETGHLFVETRLAFAPPPAGCGELQGVPAEQGTELGEVVLGQRPGRQTAAELTIYKAMGHAMEDLVAANLVYRSAQQEGRGQRVEL